MVVVGGDRKGGYEAIADDDGSTTDSNEASDDVIDLGNICGRQVRLG
jgi:hypothetical protein